MEPDNELLPSHKTPPLVAILGQMNAIHTPPYCFYRIDFNIVLPPCLGLQSGLFTSDFPIRTLYVVLMFPIPSIYSANCILLGHPNKIGLFFFQSAVTSTLFGPNVFLNILFRNILFKNILFRNILFGDILFGDILCQEHSVSGTFSAYVLSYTYTITRKHNSLSYSLCFEIARIKDSI